MRAVGHVSIDDLDEMAAEAASTEGASGRVILHADMDAFFAAIEQRDNPELRGKPVVVGGAGRRGVVSTCSYEAREFGIRSAMPGVEAQRRCPHAIFVPPRMKVYATESATIQGIFQKYTPLVEPLSLDEAFMDVTGSVGLFGDGPTIARRIKDDVCEATALTVSVGVAPCKYAAKVASDLEKPDGLVVVPPDDVAGFLAPLPISCIWGAGRVMQQRLRDLGFHTIGDVQREPLARLQKLLGDTAANHFHTLCHGLDDRPVVPEQAAKSVSHEMTFGDDLYDRGECHRILFTMAERVGRRLRRAGIGGRTIRIKVRYGDFTTFTRQVTASSPAGVTDDVVLHQHAVQLFDALWPGKPGIRLLGVGVADLVEGSVPVQGDLFEQASGKAGASAAVLEALDQIRDRFGEDSIQHAAAKE